MMINKRRAWDTLNRPFFLRCRVVRVIMTKNAYNGRIWQPQGGKAGKLQIKDTEQWQEGKPVFLVAQIGGDLKTSRPVALTPPKDVPVGEHNTDLRQDLRWYLENFLQMPIDPNVSRASEIERTLKQWGRACFDELFNSGGHAQNWYQNA